MMDWVASNTGRVEAARAEYRATNKADAQSRLNQKPDSLAATPAQSLPLCGEAV